MQSLLPYSMESKLVPIELNMTGEPQRGFMIELDRIKIEPSRCVIIGPKSLLRKLEIVRTSPVDIAGTTKTIVKDVSIDLLAEDIALKEKFVTISIPIIRVEE